MHELHIKTFKGKLRFAFFVFLSIFDEGLLNSFGLICAGLAITPISFHFAQFICRCQWHLLGATKSRPQTAFLKM